MEDREEQRLQALREENARKKFARENQAVNRGFGSFPGFEEHQEKQSRLNNELVGSNLNQYPRKGRNAITDNEMIDLDFDDPEFKKLLGGKRRRSKKAKTYKRTKNQKRRRKITSKKRRRNI